MPSPMPASMAGTGGTFLIIMKANKTGTRNSHGETWNVFPIPERMESVSVIFPVLWYQSPMIPNIIKVIMYVGVVVYSR